MIKLVSADVLYCYDDCSILKGLIVYTSDKQKCLISADEHFWGYKDEIKNEYNVVIIKECGCGQI